jgi:tRNA nucleotidyltransferase/poly(A) polymerase
MDWKLQEPALVTLLAAFRQEYAPVYIVGGAVRDLLLGCQPNRNDLDLVVERDALASARCIADRLGWAFYPMDDARDVGRMVFAAGSPNPVICDVAGLRGGSIEADLLSRDFTINAMALALPAAGSPQLIDVCGGQADLKRGVVRRVTAMGLAEDAVRILRAIRLVAQFGFTLDDATQTQIQRLAHTVRLVSPERVRDELWKMLATTRPDQAITLMGALGVLVHVLPEVAATVGVTQSYPHYQDVFHHTVATMRHTVVLRNWIMGGDPDENPVLDALERALAPWLFRLRHHLAVSTAVGHSRADWLVWYALLHDVGKPATRTVELGQVELNTASNATETRIRFLGHERVGADLAATRLNALRFSRHEVELATAVVAAHLRPHSLHASFAGTQISRRAAYRYYRDSDRRQTGNPAGIDTLLLALADYQAIYPSSPPPNWSAFLNHISQLLAFAYSSPNGEPLPTPLVDGHELMRLLQLAPGPQVGELLEVLREAQAAGEVTTPAQALDLAAGWLRRQDN